MAVPIPRIIDDDEILVRCVVHSLFYSKSSNKIKPTCFMPPPGRKDVSVLRRAYTENDTYCKNHCKSLRINKQAYVGMSVILARHVREVNETHDSDLSIEVRATPLDLNNQIIPPHTAVFTDMPGLPMHADIIYGDPVERGQPKTGHRLLAKQLLKIAIMYRDEDTEGYEWKGPDLEWK